MAERERDVYENALEAKVAAWQAALDAYRAAVAIDGAVGEGIPRTQMASTTANGGGFDLPIGALREKNMPEAITLLLAAGRKKQGNKEIIAGLRDGGLESGARNIEASVAATLHRLKKAGVVLRFADGWDLAEHYPDHIRRKFEPKPASKHPARVKRRQAKPRRVSQVEDEQPPTGSVADRADDNKMEAMFRLLAADPSAGKTLGEVLKEVRQRGMECSRDYARVALKRLAERGRIEKRGDRYFAAH